MRIGFTLLWVLFVLGAGAPAVADEPKTEFEKGCTGSSNLPLLVCRCCDEKAKERLTPGGYELLVAMVSKDDEKAEKLRGELPLPDVMGAGMFMVGAPGECARELEAEGVKIDE